MSKKLLKSRSQVLKNVTTTSKIENRLIVLFFEEEHSDILRGIFEQNNRGFAFFVKFFNAFLYSRLVTTSIFCRLNKKSMFLQVRLELTTPALLCQILSYKYRALTDCATGDDCTFIEGGKR